MKGLLAGLGFRSATPTFEPGQELEVVVTGYDEGAALARIGDTVLRIPGAPPGLTDTTVRIEVTAFDEETHEGKATFLDRVEEAESGW